MDQLHETASVDDALWAELAAEFCDEQLLELIMLAGSYHMVSYLTNALRLPGRIPTRRASPGGANRPRARQSAANSRPLTP